MNEDRTCIDSDANLTQPRSLSDLRSFLHGYRIKAGGDTARTNRAGTIIGAIDGTHFTVFARRAAKELADLDPALSWLPAWKPRVSVAACSKGESHDG